MYCRPLPAPSRDEIVATMQTNGIQRIYTFNADDFEVFPELAVVIP
jgi:hypothetical protein